MDKFIDFVLNKRALIVLLTLVLLGVGVQAYLGLPLEAYPDVANMQVRVITQVAGKAAEEMERMVTIPLEKELNGIPRAETPRSISIFGLSVITVVFEDGVDPYVARQQVLEKIAQASLPDGVHPLLDPNASPVGEIFRYSVESKKWNAMDRKEWQDWVLDRKIKSVPGVVDVTGFGGPVKTYQVELDPDKMKALGITQDQVNNAIASANGSTGGSYIVRNDQDFMVRGMGLLRSIYDIDNIVVATGEDGIPVLLKNLADVKITPAVRKGQVGINDDDDAVEGIILMRRGENPSTAVAGLMKVWPDIAATLPPGMKIVPLYDRTALARRTMVTIGHNVAEGIILVVVMLMLFLFQVRSALICATVIPLALCVAFILLDVVGVPANLLSLGAIDFGIIVDGAIVMIENTLRHLSHLNTKNKELILSTTSKAAKEVAKPILFSKAIIVLTFLPILTFESVEGKLFRPLAITMSFTLIAAAICALTIIPVLCATVFQFKAPVERVSPISRFATSIYGPLLRFFMNNKMVTCLIATVAVFGSLMLTPMMGGEFIPELEEGNIWLRVTTIPTSVSLDHQVAIARQIRKIMRTYPIVTNVISQIGSSDDGTDPNNYSSIEFFVDLKPQEDWPKDVGGKQEVIGKMDEELRRKLPGLQFNFSQYIKDNMDETISGVKGEFAIKIYGNDLEKLDNLGKQCVHIVQGVPGMVDVACDHLLGQPQLMISIDRERAARYGINTRDILDVVETSVGGKTVTQLIEGERLFDVILRYKASHRADTGELNNIQLPTPSGAKIPLAQVAKITEEHGASAILRDVNSRRIAIKANIRGRDLISTVNDARARVLREVHLPEGYRIVYGGQSERAQHAMQRLLFVMPLTLMLIFFLLYAATGAARIAALVMLAVPLSIPGAILGLLITQTHFSISAGVGFIALFGVSVQNGVILVSLVSQLQKQGLSIRDAIMKSALIRMHPALMTTCVAMAGLIPAALSTGIGSQSQRPFAIVIVFGLIPAMALALIVLPPVYEWIETHFGNKPKKSADENGDLLATKGDEHAHSSIE